VLNDPRQQSLQVLDPADSGKAVIWISAVRDVDSQINGVSHDASPRPLVRDIVSRAFRVYSGRGGHIVE
jgi:hypothetical protein